MFMQDKQPLDNVLSLVLLGHGEVMPHIDFRCMQLPIHAQTSTAV